MRTVVMAERDEAAHVGGTSGAAAHPADDATEETGAVPAGPGDTEVPIGVPVGPEEFRRLKEQATRPRTGRPD